MSINSPAKELDVLRDAGFRVTPQRLKILKVLQGGKSGKRHFSAEDIYRAMMATGDTTAIGTVYRILGNLEAGGLVSRVLIGDGRALYELADSKAHDHMVRTDTMELIEFTDAVIEKRLRQRAAEKGCEVIDHRLVVFVAPLRT